MYTKTVRNERVDDFTWEFFFLNSCNRKTCQIKDTICWREGTSRHTSYMNKCYRQNKFKNASLYKQYTQNLIIITMCIRFFSKSNLYHFLIQKLKLYIKKEKWPELFEYFLRDLNTFQISENYSDIIYVFWIFFKSNQK